MSLNSMGPVDYDPAQYAPPAAPQPSSVLDAATLTLPDGRVLRRSPEGSWAVVPDPNASISYGNDSVGTSTAAPAQGAATPAPQAGNGAKVPGLNIGDLIKEFFTKLRANPGQRQAFHDQMMAGIEQRLGEFKSSMGQFTAGHAQGMTDANHNGVPDRMEGGGMNAPRPVGQGEGFQLPGMGAGQGAPMPGGHQQHTVSDPVGAFRRLPGTAGNTGTVPGQAEASGGHLWQRLSGLQQRLDGLRQG